MTEDLTQRAADAIRAAACTGDCGQTEEECAKERIQPFVWHHGRLAGVEGSPEMFAAAVLAELKPELDALAALREVARGYCGECGRGDAAPTVADWECERKRADQAEAQLEALRQRFTAQAVAGTELATQLTAAEAAIERVRAHAIQSRDHTAAGIDDYQIGQHDLAVDVLAKLDEPTPGPAGTEGTGHRYLSTGCLHGDLVLPDGRTGHQYCQSDTGKTGEKTPAQCKFCAAPCQCPCHTAAARR